MNTWDTSSPEAILSSAGEIHPPLGYTPRDRQVSSLFKRKSLPVFFSSFHRGGGDRVFNMDGTRPGAGRAVEQHSPDHHANCTKTHQPRSLPPSAGIPHAAAAFPTQGLGTRSVRSSWARMRNPFRSSNTGAATTNTNSTATASDESPGGNSAREAAGGTGRKRAQTCPEGGGGRRARLGSEADGEAVVAVARPQLGLQHPRPVRGGEMKRLASLCKYRNANGGREPGVRM